MSAREAREGWALFSSIVYTFLLSLSIVGAMHYGVSPVNNLDKWGFMGGLAGAFLSFAGLVHSVNQLQRETGISED